MIAVSIVSHGHGKMVERLVAQLWDCDQVSQIIVTLNVPESLVFCCDYEVSERLIVIRNITPRGFGENHNAAFKYCRQPYFCSLNPDITLIGNPFAALLDVAAGMKGSLVAPVVLSPEGGREDSVRRFPTVAALLKKAFGAADDRYPLMPNQPVFYPEWVAGMFMLFRSLDFSCVGGFDEKFFLYYEDVDICARIWKAGMRVVACPSVSVVHAARRDSHKKIRYMKWHFASMLRYFCRYAWRQPRVPNFLRNKATE